MPYDPDLVNRLASFYVDQPDLSEKKMFGGIGWMLNGNMCFGVYKEFLIVRVGTDAADAILTEPHVKPMDITGKPMSGWAMVSPDGLSDDDELKRYVDLAIEFVYTLPEK